MVNCEDGFCHCDYCSKTFLQREIGKLKRPEPKTDIGGVLMDDDG